jgi:hypothetical protein
MDPEAALPPLDTLDIRDPLAGVARYPFLVEVVPDVVDSWSDSPPKKTLRVASISESVRDIRSRRFFHLWADSACLRKVSPFFVTRSRTPLSIIDRTLDVAGM